MKKKSAFFTWDAVGVVFPFNEVNAGVFQNAGLWAAKDNFGVETTAYSPNQFRGLYFAVDKFIEINPLPYSKYQEVAEYEPNTISRKDAKTWLSKGTFNYVHHRALEMLPDYLFHSLPKRIRSDYKTRKYLVDSGVLELTRRNFYSCNSPDKSIFLGDAFYFDMAKFEYHRKNLKNYFQYSFENLYNMIKANVLNNVGEGEVSLSELMLIKPPLKFLEAFSLSNPKIFLRTRNINSSVRFQNAPVSELQGLVKALLKQGFVVINSGVPVARLNIEDDKYFEFSHNLPIQTEMYLANNCDYVMQTAWAGLFTSFASFNKPLITFSEEWSLTNIPKPVSLLGARRIVGIKDIDLGVNFAENDESIKRSVAKIVSNW